LPKLAQTKMLAVNNQCEMSTAVCDQTLSS